MPTKKKKRSPKQNARPQKASNSKGAPSRGFASRKSKSESEQQLRIATPSNIAWLSQSGLIVPDDLDPSDESIPLDFTHLSPRRVGALHSRFAVRHAHALYVRSGVASDLLRLRRAHRLSLAKFRVRKGDDYRTDKACTEAFSLSKRGKKLEGEMLELEIRSEVLDAVVMGFEDVVKATSREMTRRDSERAPRD